MFYRMFTEAWDARIELQRRTGKRYEIVSKHDAAPRGWLLVERKDCDEM